MPRLRIATADLTAGFAAIRAEQQVPVRFPPDVDAAAERLADLGPRPVGRTDRRDLQLVSLDPAGSRDLDQAFHLARRGSGYRFAYAIADVGGWLTPGDPIDVDSHTRGTTIYCPDTRIPLHPLALSEDAASLLPDADRPAVLWTIDLDQRGAVGDVSVERALVRSRRALDYVAAQERFDDGTADEQVTLLAEIGNLRLEQEQARGGVSLTLPEQVVERRGEHYELTYGITLDTERWNAQLSLCTGMAAAALMIDHGVGVLRTLPPAPAETLESLRSASIALGVDWPPTTTYAEWVRCLDPAQPRDAALMVSASRTLRGAAYLSFDHGTGRGSGPTLPGEPPVHAAIASPYAHVTAPLRRLVDRYGTECVLAAVEGRRPPGWVLDALPSLPSEMERATSVAGNIDRACIDLLEAAVLAHHVGDEIEATITAVRKDGSATVQLADPAVIAVATAPPTARPGDAVRVRVDEADPTTRALRLNVVGPEVGPEVAPEVDPDGP